jgi:chemotaxis response regulator CheB
MALSFAPTCPRPRTGKKLRIQAVIDHEKSGRLAQFLERDGLIEVIVTGSGAGAAFQGLATLQPDVLLVDLDDTKRGGRALLRAVSRQRDLPVIVLRSVGQIYSNPDDPPDSAARLCTRVITKPSAAGGADLVARMLANRIRLVVSELIAALGRNASAEPRVFASSMR